MKYFNLYRTNTPNPFKSASYERTWPSAQCPFKCPVQSCRGSEI